MQQSSSVAESNTVTESKAVRNRQGPQKSEDRLAWMALILTPGIGQARALRAMSRLRQPSDLLRADLTQLEGLGMPGSSAGYIADGKAKTVAEEEIERISQAGADFITYDDIAYPERLREIYDPPAVLWHRGDIRLLAYAGIAVVGTRQPSPYGAGMAQMLSRDLANRGMAIFSGMARGVDTYAHKGALEANGKTVAVWGTGIDVIYPKENKRLAEEILQGGGAIVSEYPLGTFPAPQNFPIRNRILSGMSVGVLVVEAAEHSGTRITARCALEQNRDVYAVPGNVTNKNAWGPNTLIKQGAKLTATWEDVWEELPSQVRVELEGRVGGGSESKAGGTASLFPEQGNGLALSTAEQKVYDLLRMDESIQLDLLIESLEGILPSAEIFNALFELELAGKVRQIPGKNYLRTF
ncbi:DNA-processing protein DprA [Terriglobus saanensis]|uniref:DNA protecting protein DprA n=1 Tax=Terriglobus saanensis (strain ATCC BAA-1853 / DSM 23119 / SP1PR4) TaxID=401053 RepID=E8V6T1_TERSS|nr:DNA protecting protein DprA [Terriglobus saanensis SP1PR4]